MSPKPAAVKAAAGGGKAAAASDFIYCLNTARNGVVITGIQKDAKFGARLVVPAEIEGFPVVAYLVPSLGIDNNNHGHSDSEAKERNQPPLESVVLPDSIIYLGESGIEVYGGGYGLHWLETDYEELSPFEDYRRKSRLASFGGSKSLKSVVFPKNLRIIPESFVSGCPSLTVEGITWPESLEAIGTGPLAATRSPNWLFPMG